MRLYDIVSLPDRWIDWDDKSNNYEYHKATTVQDVLRSELILADNLEYPFTDLYRRVKQRDGSMSHETASRLVPNACPQFANMFIESGPLPVLDEDINWGAEAKKYGLPEESEREGQLLLSRRITREESEAREGEWTIKIVHFSGNVLLGTCFVAGELAIHLSQDGRMLGHYINEGDQWCRGDDEETSTMQSSRALFALFVASFMNCGNVILEDRIPPRHERRQILRATRREAVSHKVLKVRPVKRIYPASEPTENRRDLPLHVCRGHFKTFRQDRPLFGMFSGTFWWDAYVRGAQENGIVIKDYMPVPSDLVN